MNIFPVWLVEYWPRRATLTRPLTGREIERVEVMAPDREMAAAAFRQRFPVSAQIIAISMRSATGWS